MRIDVLDPETADPAWGVYGRVRRLARAAGAADRFALPDDPAPPRSATVGGLLGGEERRVTWLAPVIAVDERLGYRALDTWQAWELPLR